MTWNLKIIPRDSRLRGACHIASLDAGNLVDSLRHVRSFTSAVLVLSVSLAMFCVPSISKAQVSSNATIESAGNPGAQSGVSPSLDGSADEPLKGLVWGEPDNTRDAVRELSLFAKYGVQALRVGLLRDTLLYAVADSIGIQLFQELPFDRLPAKTLLDSLDGAISQIESVLARSRYHRSARHFGLSTSSDNSVVDACRFYDVLSAIVRERVPGARTYYVSSFVKDDACGASVDFVLLDKYATDRVALGTDPGRYSNGSASHYGVGALAHRVDERDGVGLRQPYSAESQARFFEKALPRLMDPPIGTAPLVAVFVDNWRSLVPSPANWLDYSIADGDQPRAAWNVVGGIYSGKQRVFAFPAGQFPENEMPWLTILGLVVAVVLAVAYSATPQFRQLVPRYFLSHGFYREAVAQGRDVTPVINGALLTVSSLSVGIIGAVLFHTARFQQSIQTILYWLPASIADALMMLSERPWLLAIVVGSCAATGTLIWISLMSAASRLGRTLAPTQTLMVVLWPQWPLLLLLPIALVLPSFTTDTANQMVGLMVIAISIAYAWILVRIFLDYLNASRQPIWLAGLVVFANPVAIVVGLSLLSFTSQFDYATFLQHILLRH